MRNEGLRKVPRRMLVLTALVGAVMVGASSVSQAAHGVVTRQVPAHARLTLSSSKYGNVIFDTHGRVLYLFGADRKGTSTCYGACAKAWPPLLTKGSPAAGAGLHAKLLGTTKRKDGSLQVTYNHHPLYYFEGDTRGKIMCQHAVMHGGIWLVVKVNGQPSMAKGKTHM